MPKPLDYAVGGWTTTALVRMATAAFPYVDYLSDTNQLGDLTHSARPDIVPGVPLINPLLQQQLPHWVGMPAVCESFGV